MSRIGVLTERPVSLQPVVLAGRSPEILACEVSCTRQPVSPVAVSVQVQSIRVVEIALPAKSIGAVGAVQAEVLKLTGVA